MLKVETYYHQSMRKGLGGHQKLEGRHLMKCKEGLGQNYLSMECRCTVLTAKVLGTTKLHVK